MEWPKCSGLQTAIKVGVNADMRLSHQDWIVEFLLRKVQAMSLTVKTALEAWTRLWNGDLEIAREICAPNFTIYFGRADEEGRNPADTMVGPQELADFIGAFRNQRPGITYSNVRHIVREGHGVSLWNADWQELHVGGIDVFDFDGKGLIERVWSVTAERHVLA